MPYSLALASTPIYAFQQSDGFGQLIVVFLFSVSVYLWTIMTIKVLAVHKTAKLNKQFYEIFEGCNSVVDLVSAQTIKSPALNIYTAGVFKLMSITNSSPKDAVNLCQKGHLPDIINDEKVKIIIKSAEHGVDKEALELEKKMTTLSTIVSASPFFGLLGTVWGVMAAFTDMAKQGSADIGALAPGVSGALLTTVMGLVVAIPSVIGYNYINGRISEVIVEMENFVNEFEVKLRSQSYREQ